MLLQLLDNPTSNTKDVVLPVTLVERNTTAPPSDPN
jgi:DNA-binding LacI/PurR family transcriptional regulator